MTYKSLCLKIVCFTIFFTTIQIPCFAWKSDSTAILLNRAKKLIPKNLDKADSLAGIALERSIASNNDSLTGRSYYLSGVIHYYKGRYLLASEFYRKGLDTDYARSDDTFASALWNNIGVVYEYENDYEKAVDAYYKSLQFAEKLGDSLSIYQSYINLGLLHTWLNDFSLAEEFLTGALQYFKQVDDDNHTGLCYHNMAILYNHSGNLEKVIETYNLAIKCYQKAGNLMELSSSYHDKIDFLLATEKFSSAKQELKHAREIEEGLSNPYVSGNYSVLQGRYFLYAERNYEKAEEKFLEAVKLLESINAKKQQVNAYYMLTNLYAATGNIGKHEMALASYDSLLQENYNENTGKKIAELRALYEVNSKENQILELNNQKQQESLLRANLIIALICSVAIGMLILFINRRKVFLTRQKALLLEKENQRKKEQLERIKLEKQLREKEAEHYRLNLEKKEQELIFQTLKQANIEQVNQSVNKKLKPFGNRFSRKKDREEYTDTLQEIALQVSRDPLSDFEQMFIQMHGGFNEKLLNLCPALSQSELQMCALLRMNLPSKEMSNLLNLSVSTIDQRRHSIRKKLGLNSHENLVSYLICI